MLFIVYRIALLLGDVLGAGLVGHSVPRAAQEKKKLINPKRARAQRSAPVAPRHPPHQQTTNSTLPPAAPLLRRAFCHTDSKVPVEKKKRQTNQTAQVYIYHVTSAARRRTNKNFVLFFFFLLLFLRDLIVGSIERMRRRVIIDISAGDALSRNKIKHKETDNRANSMQRTVSISLSR